MLRLKSVHTYYGNLHVLKGISLHVRPGELVALIGANGAGKTTTLRTISGLLKPGRGETAFLGDDIAGMAPNKIVRKGISHVPEGRQVFAKMTVRANLEMGGYLLKDAKRVKERIEALASLFPILNEREDQLAGTLSGGEQQMLAIGRALMGQPRLLLLDEPSLGLAPIMAHTVFKSIARLRDQGMTILLVEQNARAALNISDRAYVMETGKVIMQGSSEELLNHNQIKRAYLGKGYQEVWE
ncbi:MAG: ABC transporter ATP-binding protein [Thermodesulfobacteriota bacterium]|nr:ABC transporter ATP-binding protein [Thermodesulfobacteriota bacterium]